jgi:hypothetical protein
MEENKKKPAENKNEQDENKEEKKDGLHNNALYAASMGRPATAQVDPHSNSGLANTGTNISYEGPTAPGAGGSVGTGYASGKTADDPKITTDSDYDRARIAKENDEDESRQDEEKDII